jgi:hypothetical protein
MAQSAVSAVDRLCRLRRAPARRSASDGPDGLEELDQATACRVRILSPEVVDRPMALEP